MKPCINCYTLNPDDVVFCSKCGMSLMGAPTGEEAIEEAMRRAEEAAALEEKRREERQRRLQQPLTASGIVYLFGDLFAPPLGASSALRLAAWSGTIMFSHMHFPVRVPCSGQKVEVHDLGRKLLEAAFVFLAQEGYISLRLENSKTLFLSGEAVTISQERSGDDLPPSLERSIMDALTRAPEERWLRAVVRRVAVGKRRFYADRRMYCFAVADVVAEALMEMNWLQRGVPTEEAAPLLDAMAGEAETVKARLGNFAALNPHLHTRLVNELMRLR